jgi:AcrR family transcriptional regulator
LDHTDYAPARAGRRRAASGYPTGDDTRQRLLAAACEVFAQRGFELASTRDIAARAGVKSPALSYYFGDKLGLYLACVDSVTSRIKSRLEPVFIKVEEAVSKATLMSDLIELYCLMQESLLDSFFTPGEGDTVKALTWNTQFAVKEALDLMNERVTFPLMKAQSAVLGVILGRTQDDLLTRLHVIATNGLFMNFYLSWPCEPLVQLDFHDPANLHMLKGILRQQAEGLLFSLAKRPGAVARTKRKMPRRAVKQRSKK